MPTFQSQPLNAPPTHRLLKRYPLLFGVPFIAIIVGASYLMTPFTQTRYDLQKQKVTQLKNEDDLGMKKSRKKFDIREEYYRLRAAGEQEWEPKRIERPAGVPEWGVPPTEPSKPRA